MQWFHRRSTKCGRGRGRGRRTNSACISHPPPFRRVTKTRSDVFNYLREKQFSIYCLQDTHFTKNYFNYIRSQWGFEIFCSPGSSNARGVAILFNNNFEYILKNEKIDAHSNMIKLELEIENKFIVSLINLYGPNADSPHFYTEINDIISASLNEFTIICGDYNLIQDSKLDYYNYSTINNPKARIELLKLKQENNLIS